MKKSLLSFVFSLLFMMPIGHFSLAAIYLSEDFESIAIDSKLPTGWDNSLNTNIPPIRFWSKYSGGYVGTGLRFDSKDGGAGKYNTLYSVAFGIPLNADAQVEFMFKNPSGGFCAFCIQTETGLDTLSTNMESVTEWSKFVFPLTKYAGKSIRLVWYSVSNFGSGDAYHYLDDVLVHDRPICARPVNISALSLTQNSVKIGWDLDSAEVNPYTYKLVVKQVDGTEVVNNTFEEVGYSTLIEGLQPGTTYNLILRGDCNSVNKGDSEESEIFTFTTLVAPVVLPYNADFADIFLPIDIKSDGAVNVSNTHYWGDSGYSVKMNSSVDKSALLIFPQIAHPANDIEFSAKLRSYKPGTKFSIGLMSDPSDYSTFIPVSEFALSKINEWIDFRTNMSVSVIADSNYSLALLLPNGVESEMFIDNVVLRKIPTCPRLENVKIVKVDSISATVEYDGHNSSHSSYFEIVEDGAITSYQSVASYPAVITGLKNDNRYTIRVCDVCAVGDTSEWSLPVSFRTTCLSTNALGFAEDFENVASKMPLCWTQRQTVKTSGYRDYGDNAWELTQSKKYSGRNSIKLKESNKGIRTLLISAPIYVDEVGKYDFSFYFYRNSLSNEGEGINVWVSNTPDTIGAQKCDYINAKYDLAPYEDAEGFYKYEYNIKKSGAVFIIFEGISQANTSLYLDDVNVYLAPSCRKLKKNSVSVESVALNSARLSWPVGEKSLSYVLKYNIISEGKSTPTIVKEVVDNGVDIRGLASTMHYTVKGIIASVCAVGDTSEFVPFEVQFNTQVDIVQLPFVQNFNDPYFPPVGWCITDNEMYQTTQFGNGSGAVAYFRGVVDTALLISPQINIPNGDYILSCKIFRRNQLGANDSIEGFEFFVNDKPSLNGAVSLNRYFSNRTKYPEEISEGVFEYHLPLTGFSGLKYIVIEAYTNGNAASVLEEISVSVMPNCMRIQNFKVDSVDHSSVSILLPEVCTWEVEYGPSKFLLGNGTKAHFNNVKYGKITGLSHATTYDFYVRKICGKDTSAWTYDMPISVTTLCLPFAVSMSNQFFEGFEGYADGDTIDGCFVRSSPDGRFKHSVAYAEANQIVSYEGQRYSYQKYDYNAWSFMAMNLKASSNYEVSGFFVQDKNGSNNSTNVSLGLATAPFYDKCVVLAEKRLEPAVWTDVVAYFNVPADGVYYVGWKIEQNNTPYMSGMDNLRVRELACIPPTSSAVQNLSSNAATIQWNSIATQWEILVANAPIDKMHKILFRDTVDVKTVTLNNLTPNTEYFYYLRSFCSGIPSEWTKVSSFRTKCLGVDVPYNMDFEDFESSLDKLSCWTILGDDAVVERVDWLGRASKASLKLKNVTFISPELNVNSLTDYYVNGWFNASKDSLAVVVGVMTDVNNIQSFEPLKTITLNEKDKWVEFTSVFDILSTPDYVDFAGAKYIVIAVSDPSAMLYVDNLTIDKLPSCPKPIEPVVTDVTSSSFKLNWTPVGAESSWRVRANVGGILSVDTLVSVNSVTIGNLKPNTDYNISVVAVCDVNNESAALDCGSVQTACDVFGVPYTMYLPDNTNNTLPSCWDIAYSSGDSRKDWQIKKKNNALALVMDSNKDKCIIHTPLIDLSGLVNPKIQLDIKIYKADTTFVFALKDGSVKYDTVGFYLGNTKGSAIREIVEFDLTPFVGQKVVFAIQGGKTNLYYGETSIFGMKIDAENACPKPQLHTIENVTDSSIAVLIADADITHTKWHLVCVPKGAQPNFASRIYEADSKNFVITGLASSTEYDVYVRSVCEQGIYSLWNTAVSVKTACPTESVPYFEGFENCISSIESTCFTFAGMSENSSTPKASLFDVNDNFQVDYVSEGEWSMGLKSHSVNDLYFVLPNFSDSIRSLNITFDYRNEGETYNDGSIIVGYVTTISNIQGSFVPVYTCPLSASFKELSLDLDTLVPSGVNGLVAFKYDGKSDSYFAAIDNIRVVSLNSCRNVSVAGLVSADNTSLKLKLNGKNLNHVQVAYDVKNVTPDKCDNLVEFNSEVIDLTNLSVGTTYNIYVRSICSKGDTSEWSDGVCYSTACEDFVVSEQVEYYEDFENLSSMITKFPSCMSKLNTLKVGPNYYPYVNNKGAISGKNGLTMRNVNMIALPKFNYNTSKLILTVSSKSVYGNVGLKVGVTNSLDVDSVKEVAVLPNTNQATIHSVDLFDAPHFGNYIVLYPASLDGDICIDDISVRLVPACYKPRKVKIEKLGDTYASLSWDGGEAALSFQYRLTDFTSSVPVVSTGIVGTAKLDLSNLNVSSRYSLEVRTICGVADTTDWAEAISFQTMPTLAIVPYVTSFDNDEENGKWVFQNGAYRDKFIFGLDSKAVKSGNKSLYLSNGSDYAYNGSMFDYGTYGYTIESFYVSRAFEFEPGQYEVSYLWKGEGYVSSNGVAQNYGRIFISPTFDELQNGTNNFEDKFLMVSDKLHSQSEWKLSNNTFIIDKAGTYNFVVAWYHQSSSYSSTPLAIDSIVITKPVCASISKLNLMSVMSDSVSIEAQNINTQGYLKYYLMGGNGLAIDTTSLPVGVNTLSLGNLQPNSAYTIYVSVVCDSEHQSTWKSISFKTHCSPDTVTFQSPYKESFEGITSDMVELDDCWNEISERGSYKMLVHTTNKNYNRVPYDGTNYLALDYGNTNVVYRDFYLEEGVSYGFSVWSTIDSGDDECNVSLIAKVGDRDSIMVTNAMSATYSKTFAKFTPAKTGVYTLGIRMAVSSAAWYGVLDLIELVAMDVAVPDGLTVAEVGSNSAKILWNKMSDSCEVQLMCGSIVISDTILSPECNSIVLTNLSGNSSYSVKIRARRGDRTSEWTGTVFFNTLCEVLQVPYKQTFSSYGHGEMVHCWDAELGTMSDGAERWKVYVSGLEQEMRLRSSYASGLNRLTTNQFYISADKDYYLSFDYKVSSPYDSMQVYISNDGGVTFTDTILNTSANIALNSFVYSLRKYAGDTISFVFSSEASGISSEYYISVDNFAISCIDEILIEDTICYGTQYLANGFSIPVSELYTSGLHEFKRYESYQSADMCNVMTRLKLYVRPNISQVLHDTVCEGDVYVSEAFPDGLVKSGKYIKKIKTPYGCDSLITLYLVVGNPRFSYDHSICMGQSYDFNGKLLTESGVYSDTIVRSGKCDSIVTLNLRVLPTLFSSAKTICEGESYLWLDTTLTTSGFYERRYVNHIGCDSVYTIDFRVLPSEINIDSTICYGKSVQLGTNTYSVSGDYSFRFENSLGCDSIVKLHLIVLNPDTTDYNEQLCAGENYSGFGFKELIVTKDTTLIVNRKDADGCEVVQRINIDFIEPIIIDTTVTIADGESYLFCGNSLTKPGKYDCTLRSVATGCDSIVNLSLVVATSVDNITTLPLILAPNPISKGEVSYIRHSWTDSEIYGMRVEILDALGKLISTYTPQHFPIQVSDIDISGVYYVRIISGTGDVYIARLVVR